jgi:hypothetical protein
METPIRNEPWCIVAKIDERPAFSFTSLNQVEDLLPGVFSWSVLQPVSENGAKFFRFGRRLLSGCGSSSELTASITAWIMEPATWIEQATCGLRISDRGIAGRRMKAGNPLPSLGGTLIHSLGSVPRYQAAFICFGMAF